MSRDWRQTEWHRSSELINYWWLKYVFIKQGNLTRRCKIERHKEEREREWGIVESIELTFKTRSLVVEEAVQTLHTLPNSQLKSYKVLLRDFTSQRAPVCERIKYSRRYDGKQWEKLFYVYVSLSINLSSRTTNIWKFNLMLSTLVSSWGF